MRKAKKPATPKPRKELTSAEVQEQRAKAFFEMEQPLRECFERAEIAAMCLREGRSELAENVIYELEEMLGALKTEYLKASTSHAE
jgi:hypothetical protein